jgi:hypothetical protein
MQSIHIAGADSMFELRCKRAIEAIFARKFVKVRPDWLISPRGNSLEIDWYNDELKIGFECNGSGHTSPHDELKQKVCKEVGVLLVTLTSDRSPGDLYYQIHPGQVHEKVISVVRDISYILDDESLTRLNSEELFDEMYDRMSMNDDTQINQKKKLSDRASFDRGDFHLFGPEILEFFP